MDWNQLISTYRKSGMSASAFARGQKISVSSFFYHLDKANKAAKKGAKKAHTNGHATNGHHKTGFIDLTAKAMIEVETKSGTILRLPTDIDPAKLKEILEVLQ